MRIIYMGTPHFAVPTLQALVEAGHEVILAVSQPDRPVGRGLVLKPTPVREAAEALGVPVFQPATLNDPDVKARFESLAPEAIVVAAYGKILPKWLLELPERGCLNVHGSILPAYRGAAPIQRAVMDGVPETGVTVMRMDEGMDTGDMLLVKTVAIGPEETSGELTERLATLGASAMVEALERLAADELPPEPQDESRATYAPKIEKSEAGIDWTAPCRTIANKVRALNPAPGAFTELAGRRFKILRARPVEVERAKFESGASAGTVLDFDDELGPVVLCGDGVLALTELQPAGKRAMSGVDVARGRYLKKGDRLGHD